ncbi:hypothetical protein [Trujillonella humicola]|uniref:hypothetical protein n=1 Tax=Trujillonella humicola TaxID=3383699 RepID=UPI0039059F4E
MLATSVADAFALADLTVRQLWVRYLALGGDADEVEVDAFVHELAPMSRRETDVLVHTLNERLQDLRRPMRLPYSWSASGGPPPRSPAATLLLLQARAARRRAADVRDRARRALHRSAETRAVAVAALEQAATLCHRNAARREALTARGTAGGPRPESGCPTVGG